MNTINLSLNRIRGKKEKQKRENKGEKQNKGKKRKSKIISNVNPHKNVPIKMSTPIGPLQKLITLTIA